MVTAYVEIKGKKVVLGTGKTRDAAIQDAMKNRGLSEEDTRFLSFENSGK